MLAYRRQRTEMLIAEPKLSQNTQRTCAVDEQDITIQAESMQSPSRHTKETAWPKQHYHINVFAPAGAGKNLGVSMKENQQLHNMKCTMLKPSFPPRVLIALTFFGAQATKKSQKKSHGTTRHGIFLICLSNLPEGPSSDIVNNIALQAR